ncbi:unnamed protein product, partial [Mesorhabditis belari]|uniref:C2H2-type domain-containing protein n=1 Tax=Mesorhabditis belari TaxID=2138241 RepID=A0AAF3EWA6_9BILA
MDLNTYWALAQSGLLQQQIEKQQTAQKMPSPLPTPQLTPQLYAQMLYQQLIYQQFQQQQQQAALSAQPKDLSPGFPLLSLNLLSTPSTSISPAGASTSTQNNNHLPIIQKPIPIKATSPILQLTLAHVKEETSQLPAFTPEATPSPVEETSRPSPPASTSSARHSQEDEEDDEEMYIDVEDIEDKESGKNKRKAHIEFYRKVKALRHRNEKRLQCAKCDELVINNDATVTEHVQAHAHPVSFRCLVCGWEASVRTSMYAHMNEKHPKKRLEVAPPKKATPPNEIIREKFAIPCKQPTSFSDRRDMTKLCAMIGECFPKAGPKIVRQSLAGYVDQLVKEFSSRGIDKAKCKLCEKWIPVDKAIITKHIHSHPAYRCKTCRFTSTTSEEQTEHLLRQHNISDPKLSIHFNQCTAAEALSKTFQRSFGDLLP